MLRWARVLVARVLPLCPLYVRCIAVAAWVIVASAFRKALWSCSASTDELWGESVVRLAFVLRYSRHVGSRIGVTLWLR